MPMLAESANLLVIEKALKLEDDAPEEVHMVRMLGAPLIKVPMLWMKVSLYALLYPLLDFQGHLAMLVPIVLGFYGFQPVVGGMISVLRKTWSREPIPVCCPCFPCCSVCFFFLTFVIITHFAGIFLCEQSHDFSIFHGCTSFELSNAPSNATLF